jgi:DNA topoisomerase-2
MSKSKSKSIEEKYSKQTQHEHIYKKPDTYIGSVESDDAEMWIYDDETNKIVKKEFSYVPGLYKIYDEIIVNANDHAVRTPLCKSIKVNIDQEEGLIEVWNDGPGIDVVIHKEHNVYVPKLIFGELLTSTNYDDDEKKIVGGKNGYGAKLANIFSTEFIIETVDGERQLKYVQKFEDNMWTVHDPVIKKCSKSSYTKISFKPDFKRFGLDGLSDDMVALMKKRVYDIAMCRKNVKVHFNDELINIKNFEKFINYFLDDEYDKICEIVNDRWKVCVVYRPGSVFQQVSYVNGINTCDGGTHVDYVTNQIVKYVTNVISKKKIKIKPGQVKEHLMVFVECSIENPNFSSQAKVSLTSKVSNYGSKCVLTDKFIKKVISFGLVDRIIEWSHAKENLGSKKTDGKKSTNIRGIPKLEDANKAGTKESSDCRLFLTEGDSAKALVVAGLSVIGREYYGVFPLKGKPLNVRDVTQQKINDNAEISNIKKIMGLQNGKTYTSVSQLRYGGIVIFTDQDTDGSHIKGLIMNFLQFFWPSLAKMDGFIQCMTTPVVKVFKGKQKMNFYSEAEYENWLKDNENNGWKHKFYKGLGTSTALEAREYFKDYHNSVITYCWTDNDEEDDNKCAEALALAFAKDIKKIKDEETWADKRKGWLLGFDRNEYLDNDDKNVPIHEFINRELIHFSTDDNDRSIPNIMDGLKVGQRKIMYATILRKLYNSEIKVAQLAGYVAEKTCYHHGEKSLVGAIIVLAQNFIGSNNINLLEPNGQFGTRLLGGKDHASERYIFTQLSQLIPHLFKEEDKDVLTYLEDDGTKVEPEWFCPIMPLVLVNGADGIGTGWSTSIPCFNPIDINKNIRLKIEGKPMKTMKPFYKFFKGHIIKVAGNKYEMRGEWEQINDNTLEITELPVGTWTNKYTEFLEESLIGTHTDADKKGRAKEFVESYKKDNTDVSVKFIITFPEYMLNTYIEKGQLESKLKLVSSISLNNMHLHNADRTAIVKYDSPNDIIDAFYDVRMDVYLTRKEHLLQKYNNELDVLKWKILFMTYVMDKTIVVFKQKLKDIENKLEELKFPRMDSGNTYNYLLSMKIYNFTEDEINKLNDDHSSKKEQLEELENKTLHDLWTEDLDDFDEAYNKWYDLCMEEYEKLSSQKTIDETKGNKGNKGNKGKTTKKVIKKKK